MKGVRNCLASRAFDHPEGLLGRMGGHLMAMRCGALADKAIQAGEIQAGERVLEVGCGPGVVLQKLVAAGARTTGVDPSLTMCQMACARNKRALAAGMLEVSCAPAERLPFIDEAFDKALAVNCIHVWGLPMRALHELRRVLRPGGRLVIASAPKGAGQLAGILSALQMAQFSAPQVIGSADEGMIVGAFKPRCTEEQAGFGWVLSAAP